MNEEMMMEIKIYLRWMGLSLLLTALLVNTASAQGSSLAFVMDVTGSMSGELAQVKVGSVAILNAAVNSPHHVFVNFIIVPFRDPDVEAVTITNDSTIIAAALQAITVGGGGNCPEASLSGIKKALNVSLPRSSIYVFTDASASDFHLLNDVLTLIQEKESKVIFVMSGNCGNLTEPGYTCYVDIAAASSGELIMVNKEEVAQILDSVIERTIPNGTDLDLVKLNLLSLSFASGGSTSGYKLTIDSQLDEFTVSLSGSDPVLELFQPNGEHVDVSNYSVLLNLSNIYIIKLDNPEAGEWNLSFSSSSFHTLRVTGTSALDFDQRFGNSYLEIEFAKAANRPIVGAPTYIYINCTGLEDGAHLKGISLLSIKGEVMETRALHLSTSDQSLYYSDSVIVPNDDLFNIWVFGVGSDGSAFSRSSKSALSALQPIVVDECKLETANCHRDHGICNNTDASYLCECDSLSIGDGVVCRYTPNKGDETLGANGVKNGVKNGVSGSFIFHLICALVLYMFY